MDNKLLAIINGKTYLICFNLSSNNSYVEITEVYRPNSIGFLVRDREMYKTLSNDITDQLQLRKLFCTYPTNATLVTEANNG